MGTVDSRSLNQIHNHTLNSIKAILEVKVDDSPAEIRSLRTAESFLRARLQLKIDKRLKRLTHEVPNVSNQYQVEVYSQLNFSVFLTASMGPKWRSK